MSLPALEFVILPLEELSLHCQICRNTILFFCILWVFIFVCFSLPLSLSLLHHLALLLHYRSYLRDKVLIYCLMLCFKFDLFSDWRK